MHNEQHIQAVRRMQQYIDTHIAEPIALHQLAHAAGYSPWYCAKLFRQLTEKSPFEYIRSLRLSKAAMLLRDSRHRIVDVALDFVFDSHEGFTRAFSRSFGLTPSEYRRRTPPIQLFMPSPVQNFIPHNKGGDCMQNKPVQTVFVQVIERPARKMMLRRGKGATEYFSYCKEVGCDVWSMLCSIKEALYEPIGAWLPPGMIEPGTSKYVQGVELPLDYSNEIPKGYEIVTLPPCHMMVFQGEPFDDDDFIDAIATVERVIDGYDPTPYGFVWADDDAPRFQLAPLGYRGYMEARPVQPANPQG